MAGGSDMPGSSHRGRVLPPWEEQGAKMVLLDYDEESPTEDVAKGEPAMSEEGQPVSPLAFQTLSCQLLP